MTTVLSISLGKTLLLGILVEMKLFCLIDISYQKPYVFSVFVLFSNICPKIKLNGK